MMKSKLVAISLIALAQVSSAFACESVVKDFSHKSGVVVKLGSNLQYQYSKSENTYLVEKSTEFGGTYKLTQVVETKDQDLADLSAINTEMDLVNYNKVNNSESSLHFINMGNQKCAYSYTRDAESYVVGNPKFLINVEGTEHLLGRKFLFGSQPDSDQVTNEIAIIGLGM